MHRSCCPKLPIALPATLGFLLFASGCGIDPETLDSLTQVVNRNSDAGLVQGNSDLSDSFSQSIDNQGGRVNTGSGDDSLSAAHSFKPLYPDRENPFVYPSDVDTSTAAPTSTSVAEIQVMGFANVQSGGMSVNGTSSIPSGESKVLLKTNHGIKSLAVGDQVGQITVLRIDPPTVELKMGSLIWTATMFDR
ncbi:hypothetical protein [Rubripirellula obstinata]|nr:hypothetical protein [Rubripirellula obstinata]